MFVNPLLRLLPLDGSPPIWFWRVVCELDFQRLRDVHTKVLRTHALPLSKIRKTEFYALIDTI